ncbi:MAG: hypothetical protein AAF525_15100, partial [Pseudomonadota bacterium]
DPTTKQLTSTPVLISTESIEQDIHLRPFRFANIDRRQSSTGSFAESLRFTLEDGGIDQTKDYLREVYLGDIATHVEAHTQDPVVLEIPIYPARVFSSGINEGAIEYHPDELLDYLDWEIRHSELEDNTAGDIHVPSDVVLLNAQTVQLIQRYHAPEDYTWQLESTGHRLETPGLSITITPSVNDHMLTITGTLESQHTSIPGSALSELQSELEKFKRDAVQFARYQHPYQRLASVDQTAAFRWLQEASQSPDAEPLDTMRYALALGDVGLLEPARKVLEKRPVTEKTPYLQHYVLGSLWQLGEFGHPGHPGFDRARAIHHLSMAMSVGEDPYLDFAIPLSIAMATNNEGDFMGEGADIRGAMAVVNNMDTDKIYSRDPRFMTLLSEQGAFDVMTAINQHFNTDDGIEGHRIAMIAQQDGVPSARSAARASSFTTEAILHEAIRYLEPLGYYDLSRELVAGIPPGNRQQERNYQRTKHIQHYDQCMENEPDPARHLAKILFQYGTEGSGWYTEQKGILGSQRMASIANMMGSIVHARNWRFNMDSYLCGLHWDVLIENNLATVSVIDDGFTTLNVLMEKVDQDWRTLDAYSPGWDYGRWSPGILPELIEEQQYKKARFALLWMISFTSEYDLHYRWYKKLQDIHGDPSRWSRKLLRAVARSLKPVDELDLDRVATDLSSKPDEELSLVPKLAAALLKPPNTSAHQIADRLSALVPDHEAYRLQVIDTCFAIAACDPTVDIERYLRDFTGYGPYLESWLKTRHHHDQLLNELEQHVARGITNADLNSMTWALSRGGVDPSQFAHLAAALEASDFPHAHTLAYVLADAGRYLDAYRVYKPVLESYVVYTPDDYLVMGRIAEGLGFPSYARKLYLRGLNRTRSFTEDSAIVIRERLHSLGE